MCLALGSLSAARAGAAESTPGTEGAPASPPRQAASATTRSDAGPTPEAREQALQLIRESDRFFRAGDAGAAVPLLERAYALGGWPGCLLNLAMAQHALSRCELARDYYQRFLGADPYTERRPEVLEALQELAGRCGVSSAPAAAEAPLLAPPDSISALSASATSPLLLAAASTSPVTPALRAATGTPADRAAPHLRHAVEWSLFGAGAVTGITTLVFTLASHRQNVEANEFPSFDAGDPRARQVYDTGKRYNQLAWGFGVGTALLLGSGATLWALEAPAHSSVAVAIDSFPSVRYQGCF